MASPQFRLVIGNTAVAVAIPQRSQWRTHAGVGIGAKSLSSIHSGSSSQNTQSTAELSPESTLVGTGSGGVHRTNHS